MTVTNETERKQTIYENICEYSAKNIMRASLAFNKLPLILVAIFILFSLLLLQKAAIILLLAIAIIVGLAVYQNKRNEKIDRKTYGMVRRIRTYFYENAIFAVDEADGSKMEIGYHQVQKVMETKNLYILKITSAALLVLDKNGFCKRDETRFQAFLLQKMAAYRGKEPVKAVALKPTLPPIPAEQVRYQTGCQYTLKKEALLLRRTMKIWYIGVECIMVLIILWGIWNGARNLLPNIIIMLLLYLLLNYGGAWMKKSNMEKIYGSSKNTKIYFLENELVEVDEVRGDYRKIRYDFIDCISERKTYFLIRYVKGAYLIIDKSGNFDVDIKSFLNLKCTNAKWGHLCL